MAAIVNVNRSDRASLPRLETQNLTTEARRHGETQLKVSSIPYNHGTPMRNRLFSASLALIFLLNVSPSLATEADFAKTAAADKKTEPKKDLAKEINAVLSQPPLNRAHWGVDVVDLDTGKALYSENSDQLFLPASNAKLFTTAAALAI